MRAKSNGDFPEDLEREGDREYIAPEILGGRYGKEADIFRCVPSCLVLSTTADAGVYRSLGLIILEAAANVVLPDNGPSWHKLRSNDFSDVELSRLSHDLVVLLHGMLDKSPDRRPTINDVVRQPIIARLGCMLGTALRIEQAGEEGEQELPILGAILPQREDFIFEVFSSVYHYTGGSAEGDDERDDMEIDG